MKRVRNTVLDSFHQRARELNTTMSVIAGKLGMKPRYLGAHIWQGTLPYHKIKALAGHLNLSLQEVREKIMKDSGPTIARSRVGNKKKKGKRSVVKKALKEPAAETSEQAAGTAVAEKGSASDSELLELIDSLDQAQVADHVDALGVRRLYSLQQAQGQQLTIEALKILADWLEFT